jgi:hypothetical protein
MKHFKALKNKPSVSDSFRYIKASYFFEDICPEVINWKHKMRGKNGRGMPLTFTDADIITIRKGISKLTRVLSKQL